MIPTVPYRGVLSTAAGVLGLALSVSLSSGKHQTVRALKQYLSGCWIRSKFNSHAVDNRATQLRFTSRPDRSGATVHVVL
uniref:Putative secreted peptide n=1 Tax=Anopheles braziliensis TaxID=58242 RepID=A0A2M3ZW95_9DIPT